MQCLEDEVQRLRDERDMYRKLFESALSNVDRVFQLCQENPEPILPDFAIAGENKFRAVVRLAEDYKRLRGLLKRCVSGLKHVGSFEYRSGDDPHPLDCSLAGRVSHVFGMGMTRAHELCLEFVEDPYFKNEAEEQP